MCFFMGGGEALARCISVSSVTVASLGPEVFVWGWRDYQGRVFMCLCVPVLSQGPGGVCSQQTCV